jgi:DNA mismatch repair protein MutL
MSSVIKLLPEHIANQIAAGEVIQRPSSVVKEMVENAIDAGATKIQVVIKDSGKTLIQITDNGDGMSSEDAILCFERHATSKVQKVEDLFALTTKGFRGEALASIASIAHVTLKTRRADSDIGHLIEIEGGKIRKNEPCVCATGTSFEVKNLFYNVPARRNFLKSDNVEFTHIVDEFERIVLAHCEREFSLDHNEQRIYNLQSAILRKRITDVLGKNSNDKLVPIEEHTDIVTVAGYVGKPDFSKKSRGEQFLFVNNRFFKDSFFNHAVNKAFEGLIQPKTFPSYFLYLTVNPHKIDVNVHPTKTEIKFEEDKFIYAIILSSIKQALGKYNIAPTLDFDRETSFDIPYSMKSQVAVEPEIRVDTRFNPFHSNTSRSSQSGSNSFTQAIKAEGFGTKEVRPEDWQNFYRLEEEVSEVVTTIVPVDEETTTSQATLIRGNYLFSPCKSGLLVFDIQRAIERVTYDQLMHQFISKPIDSQTLLFPIEREVSSNEQNEWLNNKVILERMGFSGTFSDKQFSITAVPSILQEDSIHVCLDLIFEQIAYQSIDKGDIAHVIVQDIALASSRKKTIKTQEEAVLLIEQLFQCPIHTTTSSGKKIMETITLEEIATKF